MGFVLDTVGKWIARTSRRSCRGTSRSRRAIRSACAASFRRATFSWSKAKPYFRHHQISDAIDMVACRALCRPDRRRQRARWRVACADRGQCRRRRHLGAAVEISSVSHPVVPPGRAVARGSRYGVPLRHQPDRLRLRHQEHRRSDALPDSAAGAAALAAAHDRVRFRRSDQDYLLGVDRAGVRRGALSDPTEDHPRRQPQRPARDSAHSRFLALYAARFRYLSLFRDRQAHDRAGFRLPLAPLGRQAEAARGGGECFGPDSSRGGLAVVRSRAAWVSRAGGRGDRRRKLLAAAAIRNGGRGTCPNARARQQSCAPAATSDPASVPDPVLKWPREAIP